MTIEILFKLLEDRSLLEDFVLLCLPCNAIVFIESSNISEIDARSGGQRLGSLTNEYYIEVRGRGE